MFLSIVICVQYLLLISNSTETEFTSQFMDIIIKKFWRDTDSIRVDGFGPPDAQFQTYSWNVTERRPSLIPARVPSNIRKLHDYLNSINVTNTDLINSWYTNYTRPHTNNVYPPRSLENLVIVLARIEAEQVPINYFVDLYYANGRLHWIFVTQPTNKEKDNWYSEWYAKEQPCIRVTANVHSVNMNRTQYIKPYQELFRAMFERRNIIKNDWNQLNVFNGWGEQLSLSTRNSMQFMTMINETNRRMQLIDDETNRRTQILIKQQMRQLVDDETNKRLIFVNETLH
eukprot:187365_1